MSIINLTQHLATPEQVAAGVFDLPPNLRGDLAALLTFDAIPSVEEIRSRAYDIATMAALIADRAEEVDGADNDRGGFALQAMIGGAPYLMASLESALRDQGIEPVYAFSVRESVEKTLPDGSVQKTNVFRHVGFVKAAA
jgi:hypothetical protein